MRNMAVFARRMLAVIPLVSGFLFPGLVTVLFPMDDDDDPLSTAGEVPPFEDPSDSNGRRCVAVEVAAAGGGAPREELEEDESPSLVLD